MRVSEEARGSQEETILRPESRMLLNVWRSLKQERTAPHRRDLDLKQLPRLLPWLFIAEPSAADGSFTWRLAGTGVCAFLGRELTSKDMLSGWERFERGVIFTLLTGVVTRHQQAVVRLRFRTKTGQPAEAEMLALPMISFDGTMTHVLGGLFPDPATQPARHTELFPAEISAPRFLGSRAAAGAMAQGPRKFHVISGGLDH